MTDKPAAGERIGIFGGTFDPIHTGHLLLASELCFALRLDRVLFMVARTPPHKRGQEISADIDRVAMVEAAIEGDPRFAVSRVELERPGPSYTADTLAYLSDQWPSVSLVFLMGEDSLRDLSSWHEPHRILAAAELGVAARPGVDVDLSDVYAGLPAAVGRIHLVPTPEIDLSSSDIRRRVAEGCPIRYHVPESVERYIRNRGLYRLT